MIFSKRHFWGSFEIMLCAMHTVHVSFLDAFKILEPETTLARIWILGVVLFAKILDPRSFARILDHILSQLDNNLQHF